MDILYAADATVFRSGDDGRGSGDHRWVDFSKIRNDRLLLLRGWDVSDGRNTSNRT